MALEVKNNSVNGSTSNYNLYASSVSQTLGLTALTNDFSVKQEIDYYKYVVTEDGFYNFTYDETESGISDASIGIYDYNDNSKVTKSAYGDISINSTFLTKGTYYIKVRNETYVAVTDDYTINASKTYIQTLDLTVLTNSFSKSADEIDYYKYVVTKDGYYTFETKIGNPTVNALLSIYDSNNISKGSSRIYENNPMDPIHLKKGTYYIKVENSYNDTAYDYSILAKEINFSEIKENTSPTITSSSSGTVTENTVTSTVIYKAIATDADANTTLAYSLSGTDSSLLNINSSTGVVTLKSSANYEAKNSYSFNVIASDGNLSDTKAITVNVTNVNEFNPTSINKIITINEDIAKILTLTDFAFKDADKDSTLSKVMITQLETKGSLKLNGVDVILNQEILATDIKAGKLVFTPTLNEFGTSYSNFKFQVSDETLYSVSSYTTTFNVTQVIDTVSKSASYTLPSLIENLTLIGTSAINGTGNTLNNIITGNSANNILSGLVGDDTLDGKSGIDTLIGGLGNDTYVVDNTLDVVTELASQGTDTINSYVSYTISSNVENLNLAGYSLINGTGNTLNNTIIGNSSANTLDGKTGADIMLGGRANDTYYVDNIGDKVYETTTTTSTIDAGGTDTVNSSISYVLTSYVEKLTLLGTSAINGTGNTLNNTITGNSANNTLDGKTGIDTLIGGLGNDTYIVDITSDKITEALNAGTDTVNSTATYTLSTNVENLTLTGASAINGIGNTLNNTITGNSVNNVLNGGTGIDTLSYSNATKGVKVSLATTAQQDTLGAGTDTISNFENLTGSSYADTLTGNSADNTLNGGVGADTMLGGAGNDTYYVDNSLDKVYETKTTSSTSGDATGIDTVISTASYYILSAYVENLTLGGSTAIHGTGNTLINTIIGNSAANILDGGLGNDILNGGLGLDKFVFNTAINSITNKDTIIDFNVKDDTIHLENAIFTKLATTGTLNTANFVSNGTKALDSNDFLIYHKTNGQLFYDADGNGTKISAIQIALIENKAALTYADFTVI